MGVSQGIRTRSEMLRRLEWKTEDAVMRGKGLIMHLDNIAEMDCRSPLLRSDSSINFYFSA